MPSRRDQLQSYQFLVQRVVAALVARDPDPNQSPFRRLVGATFGGVMVAVLIMAGAGVYGLVSPGGKTSWKSGRAVIVEKETGTRYVYRDGTLHPVVNYASALLILGNAAPTVSVSRNSLVGVERGPRVGIPDAPDALPDPERLLDGEWTLCSQPERDDTGKLVTASVLSAGRRPDGGRDLGDRAVLVTEGNGRLALIWNSHRYEIADADVALDALALGQEPQVPAGAALLNALPAGKRIETLAVPGIGTATAALAGARTGQVFVAETQGGEKQHYVALADVLQPITELQADLLLTDPATRAAYPGGRVEAGQLTPGQAAAAPQGRAPARGDEQPPARRPAMVELDRAETAVCAAFKDQRSAPRVLVGAGAPEGERAVQTARQTGEGTALADRVLVEPGWGAVVEAMPSADAERGTLHLVTDLGIRYPVPSAKVLAALGYAGVEPVRLPASLVVRVPEGPALDPAAAKSTNP